MSAITLNNEVEMPQLGFGTIMQFGEPFYKVTSESLQRMAVTKCNFEDR